VAISLVPIHGEDICKRKLKEVANVYMQHVSRRTVMLSFLILCSFDSSLLVKYLRRENLIITLNICFGTTEITLTTTRTPDGVLKSDAKTCAEKQILFRSNTSNAFAEKISVSNATTTSNMTQPLAEL
jgi:hypothetical protein